MKFECADANNSCTEINRLDSVFISKTKCIAYIEQLPSLLSAKGYISASVDAVKEDTLSVYVKLFVGKKYVWDNLIIHDADNDLLEQAGYHLSAFNTKPFDPARVTQLYNGLLYYLSSNGYPFAKISLDSIQLRDEKINAALKIDKGNLYSIDSIIITSDKNISKNFLSQYLGIKEHDAYKQNLLDGINKKLAELSFLQQSQPWYAEMLNDGARLHLYLQSKQSNQVNVLVGLLPENQQLGGKLLVTGEADLALRNAFGNAESITLNWQQLQKKSPRLNILFQRPYLFKSPFGVSFHFELYKLDSFYLNLRSGIGVTYTLSEKQSGSVLFQFEKTNLLNVDTNAVKFSMRLPDIADI
ncbi:MAG TPA: hypothetical protein PL045_11275, partial [Chitinophagaceae bacterium]|nr:hypothetical protein [Chitinophagaceae bacterium]